MSSIVIAPAPEQPLSHNRARGALRADFRRVGARTEPGRVFETGGYRLRMPRSHGPHCEAVMVNTGGGMAGGDALNLGFACAEGAAVTLTSTAAEKIYRSDGAPTGVAVTMRAAARARLEWLPQETILFDGAELSRTLDVELADDATLVVCEQLVFGRLAMGEVMRRGAVRDRWRIRRDGRLVVAEDIRIEGDIETLLERPALGGGARALATLLVVSPEAERRLGDVRDALSAADPTKVAAGASAWNGHLTVRALSASPSLLRAVIVAILGVLRGRAAPRLWT